MLSKKSTVAISLFAVITAVAGFLLFEAKKEVPLPVAEKKQDTVINEQSKQEKVVKPDKVIKKAELYNSTDKNMPLSAIAGLSEMPDEVVKTVETLLQESSGGIYFMTRFKDKVFLITDLTPEGEENPIKRHDFSFVEISLNDGSIINTQIKDEDSKQDKWDFNNDLPLSHTHYDKDKKPVYSEFWDYSSEDPVKYKKVDKDGNVISLRKEVIENGVNLREEHVFYDNEGNMTRNVSFNYDGTDLTRFTYYNSEMPDDSAIIISEFEDGVKKKETLYSSDYKIKNIYFPEYKDGQKSEIKVLDKDNNLVETLVEE